jgi:hypothetical protein
MSDSLVQFFREHPFWAAFIAVFMVLPMIGAVLHIVLKALGRKGIDNSLPTGTERVSSGRSRIGGGADSSDLRRGDDDSREEGHSGSGQGG